MRIPTRRLHRAFPELDRFTDEQCKIFIRAASKHGWRPRIHAAILLLSVPLTGLLALTASSFARLWIDKNVPGGVDRPAWDWVEYAGYLLACFGAALVAFLLRDLLFISRVRRVIRGRGSCIGCRYSLLGITIAEGFTVTCPECGLSIEADPELHEITTDDSGRRQFMPSGAHEGMVFWTPRRRKRLRRASITAAVLVFVVLPLCWGGYEVFLHRQAARARAQRPGAEGVVAFIEQHQPADGASAGAADVWDIIEGLAWERAGIDEEVTARYEYLDDRGEPQDPDFDALLPGATDHPYGWQLPLWQRQPLALALLDAYREGGVLDTLDSIADAPRAVGNPSRGPDMPVTLAILNLDRGFRDFIRVNDARMHLAHRAGDLEEFARAAESGLALARAFELQGTIIETAVARETEERYHTRMREVLTARPGAAWVNAIEHAIERQRPDLPAEYPFEVQKLHTLDTFAWFFADPDNVRFGRRSGGLELLAVAWFRIDGRIGTYAQNRDAYIAAMDAAATHAGLDAHARVAPAPRDTHGLALLDLYLPSIDGVVDTLDRRAASRRATATMLALERYRLARGRYPDALAELVPDFLDALPLDPWSGEPFRYFNLTRSGTAPHYGLYALGPDMQDDGGKRSDSPGREGTDMVFSPAAN